ncbi:alpha/beta hydrolase [Undibacterium squillarum]|uniref:Alpha/beta hydrolase n=1 Tax=Undibacterium squillarum TaxID=1131567 RepID=A0ABQ2XW52_9BURK|nr:alpha/beta fold hydrolase [Undibacterium squillarum]GGX34618.1 alpha/beta hydrolase [Undibacterium squillarum]
MAKLYPVLTLTLLASATLTGCMNIHVADNAFLRPDSATGYQYAGPVSDEKIQKASPGARLNNLELVSGGQQSLKGIEALPSRPLSGVSVLYFGGNLSHADDTIPMLLRTTASCAVPLYTFDYRGYGRTPGTPDTKALKEDALKIYDEVRSRVQGKLIVHGHSLGSFMAGYIAQHRQPDGLVLETTATRVDEVVPLMTPLLLRPFTKVTYAPTILEIDNRVAVSQYRGKALVISGEKDQQTPAELGQAVFNAIPSLDKQFMNIAGAGHSGLMARADVQQSYCAVVNQLAQTR